MHILGNNAQYNYSMYGKIEKYHFLLHVTHTYVSGQSIIFIIKNLKRLDMIETLSSRSHYFCNKIKTFDFSSLFTTIAHAHLNARLKENKY